MDKRASLTEVARALAMVLLVLLPLGACAARGCDPGQDCRGGFYGGVSGGLTR